MAEPDPSAPVVRVLNRAHAEEVVNVLCDAFADYPVMRYVLGQNAEPYETRLPVVINLFVMARVLRGEWLLGVGDDARLDAVAVVSNPANQNTPPEFVQLREQVWQRLGPDARARYEAFGAAYQPLSVPVPHIHLNMIGVRRSAQKRGLARPLLEYVHQLARTTPDAQGVTLSTEDPANLPLYQHFGYQITGHARVAPELETWGLYRPN